VGTFFDTSEFKKGLKIIHNGQPYSIIEFQHVKPGKGNAFTRTRIKALLSGSVLEVTYKSGEKVEDAEIEEKVMTFIFKDDAYNFMDTKTYEQVAITEEIVGDKGQWILPNTNCDIIFWRQRAVALSVPAHMEFKVSHCEPGVRGDTATNVTKPATLETGAEINVPLFINAGDRVKVDTETGKYIERTAIGGGS
jgi:elongation factor P